MESQSVYDAISDRYDDHFKDPKSLAENRLVARLLRRIIQPAEVVVDLGSGTGLLLELVEIAPARYFGVDISERMLARARRKFPRHRFLRGDMETLHPHLPDGCADLVVSLFGSMSYCKLDRARDQVRRLLRPGGRFFLMLCGPRYLRRHSFIDQGSGSLRPVPARAARAIFRPSSAFGMSRAIDELPSWLPPLAFDATLALETATIGRILPDALYLLVLSGSRESLP